MARGEYWQEIYNPEGSDPTEVLDFKKTPKVPGGQDKIVADITSDIGHLELCVFKDCDFINKYKEFTFKKCKFFGCRFDLNAEFVSVKFTDCEFHQCYFGFVVFSRCLFRNPIFERISISSDHAEFIKTSIGAEALLKALSTNMSALPAGKDPAYQTNRLFHTKAKVATNILISTEKEPDQDVYNEAHRENVLSWLKWKIYRRKYKGERELSRKPNHNTQELASKWVYYPLASIGWIDYAITYVSGWLTNWGRSIMRPTAFILTVTVGFSVGYFLYGQCYYQDMNLPNISTATAIWEAFHRAVDISMVAGYTKYMPQSDGKSIDSLYSGPTILSFIHMLLGVYWYGLMFPVIVKRTLR